MQNSSEDVIDQDASAMLPAPRQRVLPDSTGEQDLTALTWLIAALVKEKPRRILLALSSSRPTSATELSILADLKLYDLERNCEALMKGGLVRRLDAQEVWSVKDRGIGMRSRAYYVLTERGSQALTLFNRVQPDASNILRFLNLVESSPNDLYVDGFRIRWKIIRELDRHREGRTTDELMDTLVPYVRTRPTMSYHLSQLEGILRVETDPRTRVKRYFLKLTKSDERALQILLRLVGIRNTSRPI